MKAYKPKAPLHLNENERELYYEMLRTKSAVKCRDDEVLAEALENMIEELQR